MVYGLIPIARLESNFHIPGFGGGRFPLPNPNQSQSYLVLWISKKSIRCCYSEVIPENVPWHPFITINISSNRFYSLQCSIPYTINSNLYIIDLERHYSELKYHLVGV